MEHVVLNPVSPKPPRRRAILLRVRRLWERYQAFVHRKPEEQSAARRAIVFSGIVLGLLTSAVVAAFTILVLTMVYFGDNGPSPNGIGVLVLALFVIIVVIPFGLLWITLGFLLAGSSAKLARQAELRSLAYIGRALQIVNALTYVYLFGPILWIVIRKSLP